jgi:hypothetical protein
MSHLLFLDTFEQLRNFVLIVALVILAGIIALLWKFAGYKTTYFLLSFFAVVIPSFVIFGGQWFDKISDLSQAILVSLVMELPPIVLVLSVRNLNKQVEIPKWITISNIVLSSIVIVIFLIGVMVGGGGGGMIG